MTSGSGWQIFALDVDSGVGQLADTIEKLYGVKTHRIPVKVDRFLGKGSFHHVTYGLNGSPYEEKKEKLITVKSCLAVPVLAGEVMGLDTSRARNIMGKVGWKIKHSDYLKPECRDAKMLELLEKNSGGAPNDYAGFLGMTRRQITGGGQPYA